MIVRGARVIVIALVVSAPARAVDVDALLRGIDVVPSPAMVAALTTDDRAALVVVADDSAVPLVRRVRALRLAATAPRDDDVEDVVDRAVDAVIARWLRSPDRELRVQAAWASIERARAASRAFDVAAAYLSAADPALREVGVLALWREGTPAARRRVEARLTVEGDADVGVVLRARLARWPSAPVVPSGPRQRRR